MSAEPFWKSLTDLQREDLFALMRRMGDEEAVYFTRGRETPNTIPVGAALFDETLRGAARYELNAALRKASTLEAAFDQSRAALRVWVRKHNERRSDINWQRWEESGQTELETLIATVRTTLGASK